MWQKLTDEVLTEALNGRELAALTAKRQSESSDPMPGILAGVAARIRGCIRAGGRVRLRGGEDTIPTALWTVATDLVRYQALLRFALGMTDERKLAYQEALKQLEDVAAGRFVLADEGTPKTPAPAWEGRKRRFGPSSKKGIIM